jgi:hypothetical protein
MEVEKEPEEKATKATKHLSQAATIAELRDGERGCPSDGVHLEGVPLRSGKRSLQARQLSRRIWF